LDPVKNEHLAFSNAMKSGIFRRRCKHRDGNSFPVIIETRKIDEKKMILFIKRTKPELSDFGYSRLGRYELFDTIGHGSYGRVRFGMNKETGENVAVKIIENKRMEEEEIDRTRREIQILQKLQHPNVIKLIESTETDDFFKIIQEYGGITMEQFLKGNDLTDYQKCVLSFSLVDCVNYCHKNGIVYRDISTTNILVKNNFVLKLIDFGLSNYSTSDIYRNTYCGTPAFAAPEIILGQEYNGHMVDVWSVGVVIYAIVHEGDLPFRSIPDIIGGFMTIVDHGVFTPIINSCLVSSVSQRIQMPSLHDRIVDVKEQIKTDDVNSPLEQVPLKKRKLEDSVG
jgi:serine/threonine protein kinase